MIESKKIKNIGILGTGTIGASWATFFASKGLKVKMYDIDKVFLDRGVQKAKENLDALVGYELVEESMVDNLKKNVRSVENIAQMAEDADYIQESTEENYEAKKKVFAELDTLASPKTILVSSSSGLLMSEIQKATKNPKRCLIAHPFNPPHLIPLVELVPGKQTDLQIVNDMKLFFERLGKIPVVLKKETPRHIANRLAAALWREAIDLVVKEVASVEDVDKALYAGPGIRWALMGQHLIYHLGGGEGGYGYFIDHIGKAFGAYWKEMATWHEISDESKKILVEGVEKSMGNRSFGEVARWRDEKIVDLLKVVYD